LGGKGVCVPNLEVIHKLRLCIINCFLVESGFILMLLQLVEGISILAFQIFHLLEFDQFLFIDDILSWLVILLKESIVFGYSRGHGLAHVCVLLFLSHAVKSILDFVNLRLDVIAHVSLNSDMASCFLQRGTALTDCRLMLGTRFTLDCFEFEECSLLIDRLARLGVLLSRSRHLLKHFLFLLLMNLFVMCFWEFLELLHLCDFFLALFRDLNLSDWLGFSGCNTKAKAAKVYKVSLTLDFGPLTLKLVVSRANFVASDMFLCGEQVRILLFELAEQVPHLHQEFVGLSY
jgi:hypothetical protein